MRRPSLFFLAFWTLACSGEFFKSCTSTVVGKTVSTTKEVSSGVIEGIQEGRKSGSSIDGATVVGDMQELSANASISVAAVEAAEGECRVVLAVDNRGEQPLRVTGLDVAALDKQGFIQKPSSRVPGEITVPARAKDKVVVTFGIPADQVGVVRVWNTDLPLP